ncbi:hypothetical protein [Hymenobacter volaticus]|uniref:Lipoprotein n=1 Tax=Hymenobacter volaticus TaxID=2932254 RepID=A0ABY4GF75_9BACT|nr:hypothetical protein [Hymenobacter volaticus]UOQ69598.1 hypothetical protein MUN86_29260 [Hymenobacter volaticus]
MNMTIINRLLCGLGLLAMGCKEGVENPTVTSETCAAGLPTVKTVKNVEGRILFDAALRQYCIYRALPGTIDEMDMGVLCGTLPAPLQQVESKVVFSGTYTPYDQVRPAAPVGTHYYYLEVTQGKVQTNEE